jgi:hypothetical protein
MHHRTIVFVLISSLAAFACSEANDVGPKDAGGRDAVADASAVDAGDASNVPDATLGDASITGLVFNELSATGGDWIELYNTTSSPIDVSGFKVADNEPDASAPRLTQALAFGAGTILPPGGYLVIVANEKDASSAPQPCFDGGVKGGCPVATFGISKDNANTFYLLAPNDAPVLKVDMAANVHTSGQSWGRFPNGTGDFAVTKPTPGSANAQ